MQLTKGTIIIGVLSGILLLGGFYVNRKCHIAAGQTGGAKDEFHQVADDTQIRTGDLIFQTSQSAQSKAIQLATKSKYSHCGIIFKEGEDYYVFEAVQPVKKTPLSKWIARGENGKFVIKRLKNADQILTVSTLAKMKKTGEQFKGKNYDMAFEWSDERMYCSELIWKMYQRATGLEIGRPQQLCEFDLTNELVRQKMNERYGSKIPLKERVISPVAIFNSELLTTVLDN